MQAQTMADKQLLPGSRFVYFCRVWFCLVPRFSATILQPTTLYPDAVAATLGCLPDGEHFVSDANLPSFFYAFNAAQIQRESFLEPQVVHRSPYTLYRGVTQHEPGQGTWNAQKWQHTSTPSEWWRAPAKIALAIIMIIFFVFIIILFLFSLLFGWVFSCHT